MARKSPTEWVEVRPGLECFVFNEHVVGQILTETKVRLVPNGMVLASAGDELNRAAYWLRMSQNVSEFPSSTELRKALKQILTRRADEGWPPLGGSPARNAGREPFTRYVDEVRPWLMARRGAQHDVLWVGNHGQPYSVLPLRLGIGDLT
jgi:hypothetical protein